MAYEQYEDRDRLEKQLNEKVRRTSPYCDFIYYESSRTPGIKLAARIVKPARPGYILAATHGWHMGIQSFRPLHEPPDGNPYLRVEVDMRGRPHSEGEADCNGWELFDIIDAIDYARLHYAEYLIDPDIFYFESGSGGGGNAMALAGKFPDTFAAVTALCGISDYAEWYDGDRTGEFRDEMDVWIGCSPSEQPMAYRARSGITTAGNLFAPMYIAHGETDIRVPSSHSRAFVAAAASHGKSGLVRYRELPGVGTRHHWGNATDEMLSTVEAESENNRLAHRKPIKLPTSGMLTVAGYLHTRLFAVVLDSIDKVARLEYDIQAGEFHICCEIPCAYSLTVGGRLSEGKAIVHKHD